MKHKKGLTLTEVLVVLAISAILMAILLPVFFEAKHKAMKDACQDNLVVIGKAYVAYTLKNGTPPPVAGWEKALKPFCPRGEDFEPCPKWKSLGKSGLGYLYTPPTEEAYKEGKVTIFQDDPKGYKAPPHVGGANYIYHQPNLQVGWRK